MKFRRVGDDVSGLCHKVNAAKHDRITITLTRQLAQLQAVTSQVSMGNHTILLVVMPEDDQTIAQVLFDGFDP